MENRREDTDANTTPPRRNNGFLIAAVLAIAFAILFWRTEDPGSKITASFFRDQLNKNNVERVSIGDQTVVGTFKTEPEASCRRG